MLIGSIHLPMKQYNHPTPSAMKSFFSYQNAIITLRCFAAWSDCHQAEGHQKSCRLIIPHSQLGFQQRYDSGSSSTLRPHRLDQLQSILFALMERLHHALHHEETVSGWCGNRAKDSWKRWYLIVNNKSLRGQPCAQKQENLISKKLFILTICRSKFDFIFFIHFYFAYSTARHDSPRGCSQDNTIGTYKSLNPTSRIMIVITFAKPIKFKLVITIPFLLGI